MTARFRLLLVAFMALVGGSLANGQLSFSPARNLGAPINTPSTEVGPNLSADGLTMYFVSDRTGGLSGSAELWMSTRATPAAPWQMAVNVGPPVNRYSAASPSVSSDGLELFFDNGLRVRPGGQGGGDIWLARRATASGRWDEPQNLGPVVNSPFNDGVPKLSRDGLTLFFSSDRPGGAGRRDIWVTSRATRAGAWTAPLNLGPAVNGPANDWCPAISADGLMLIFQSDRPGSFGGDDFWMSTRTSISERWSAAVHLGPEIITSAVEAKAEFPADGRTLLFASARPGGRGALDIWEIPLERVAASRGNRRIAQ
jgi:Tol biopolymer transport system component